MKYRIGILGAALALTTLMVSPVAAQDPAMIGKLAGQLGVSEVQAKGGVEAILGTVKERLSPEQFASLLDSSADLKGMAANLAGAAVPSAASEMASGEMVGGAAKAGKAAPMAQSVSEKASEGMASMSEAAGGLDLSALAQLTDLTKAFEGLGLDAGMVQKFVPVLLEQLGPAGGAAGLLKQGLGLL